MNLIEAKNWAEEMDAQVTVCDLKGVIVYMNQASKLSFHKWGGAELIGKSLLDCHNSKSKEMIREMLNHPFSNTTGISKNGSKKIIHQFPWMEDAEHKGIIELSFSLPADFEIIER